MYAPTYCARHICAFYVKTSYNTSRVLSSVCVKNLDQQSSFVNHQIKNPPKMNMERGPSGVSGDLCELL